MPDPALDTYNNDITLNPEWLEEQVNRLAGWEMLHRHVKHQHNLPMKPLDLCDKIGVNKGYVHQVIKTVQNKLNAER
jgi:hypothetical protein